MPADKISSLVSTLGKATPNRDPSGSPLIRRTDRLSERDRGFGGIVPQRCNPSYATGAYGKFAAALLTLGPILVALRVSSALRQFGAGGGSGPSASPSPGNCAWQLTVDSAWLH